MKHTWLEIVGSYLRMYYVAKLENVGPFTFLIKLFRFVVGKYFEMVPYFVIYSITSSANWQGFLSLLTSLFRLVSFYERISNRKSLTLPFSQKIYYLATYRLMFMENCRFSNENCNSCAKMIFHFWISLLISCEMLRERPFAVLLILRLNNQDLSP